MKKVNIEYYQIEIDTFKSGIKTHYASLEDFAELIMSHPDMNDCKQWFNANMSLRRSESEDGISERGFPRVLVRRACADFLEKENLYITIDNDQRMFRIWAKKITFERVHEIRIPEIKTPGFIYQNAETITNTLEPESVFDVLLQEGFIRKKYMNRVSED